MEQKNSGDQGTDAPTSDHVRQLSNLVAKKDQELQVHLLYSISGYTIICVEMMILNNSLCHFINIFLD